jgi:hypothetical protein
VNPDQETQSNPQRRIEVLTVLCGGLKASVVESYLQFLTEQN